jgi:hypothetical protein
VSNSNEWLNKIIMYASFRGLAAGLVLAGLLSVLMVESLAAQGTPPDSADAESIAPEPTGGLPVFLTFGAGYGQRSDPCAQCASSENTESFTGHIGVGKYFRYGSGMGVDAFV